MLAAVCYTMGKGVRNPCVKRRPADKRQTPMFYSAGLLCFCGLRGRFYRA